MENMSDDILLEELNRRFLENKKALYDMKVMNEKIEKLNIKLADSERLKTNFLSNIRNEINNPLSSILGIARELAGSVKDENTRRLMAQMIYNEAFDLDFQLRNIFIAAELEAGAAALSTAQTDIGALIKEVIASFAHKAKEKDVSADCSCSSGQDDPKLLFKTDPGKLHVILANLLANAIEYNRPGKKVRIEARKEDTTLTISVADQGAGIPEQERKRLFERFHQLDQGASKKHKGHGLGLCICKALVELLGGKISLVQAEGDGSVFKLAIPEAAERPGDVFSENGNEFLFDGGRSF